MNDNIISVGGNKEFTNYEFFSKEVPKLLEKHNIQRENLLVYIFDDSYDKQGTYALVTKWATENNIKIADGQPKPKSRTSAAFSIALAERNKALSQCSKILINLRVGTANGGKTFVETFEETGKPIEVLNNEGNLNGTYIPNERQLKESIKTFSAVARDLIDNAVSLDVETTGTSEARDYIVELCAINNSDRKILFNDYVFSPIPVSSEAFKINGITGDKFEGKLPLEKIWSKISKKIGNKIIVASNSKFDEWMIGSVLFKAGLVPPTQTWVCLQNLYKKYSAQPRFLVKSLNTARMAAQLDIEEGKHGALSDVTAQLKILEAMSQNKVPNFLV